MEVSRILVFLVPPQVLARFSRKILPEPEEVPKKQSSGGLQAPGLLWFFWYLLRFWQYFSFWYQKNKVFGTFFFWSFWYLLRFWQKRFVFFGTFSSFGTILLPKPEERKTHPKMRNPGMKDFFLISNENFKGNSYRGKKARNDGFL